MFYRLGSGLRGCVRGAIFLMILPGIAAWGHGHTSSTTPQSVGCVATAWRPKPSATLPQPSDRLQRPAAMAQPAAINSGATAPPTVDPGEETPQTHARVPIKLGSIDAISGEMHVRIPLGPAMPGRLKLGFNYAYDSQNGLQMLIGGDFRPVVWPSRTQKHISYSVVVQGEAWEFARAYQVTAINNLSPSQLLSKYGIDNGQAEAQAYLDSLSQTNPGIGNYALDPPTDIQGYQSMDGKRLLLMAQWHCHLIGTPETTSDGIVPVGQRMAVIDGQNFIWTNGQGVSHFQTIWGDHLVVTETDLTNNQWPPRNTDFTYRGGSIVISDVNHSDRSLILNITDAQLDVTNTFGLPTAEMKGKIYLQQRQDSDGGIAPPPLFDFGFVPTVMTETASNGETRTTNFEWYPVNSIYLMNYHYPNALKSVTYPNGLQESFTYSQRDYAHLSDFAFSPDTGGWVGFNPNPAYSVGGLPVAAVDQVAQVKGGQGTCVKFQRVIPAWQVSANPGGWGWSQKDHVTTIQSYATPDGSGPYRSIKLIHPSFAGVGGNNAWGGPGASTDQILAAYLFSTSSVVKAEFFDSSNVLYRTVDYSNWSFRSYFNSDGGVFFTVPSLTAGGPTQVVSLPLTPEPTTVAITEPGLPAHTKALSNWDHFGYAQTFLDGKDGLQEAGTTTQITQILGQGLDLLVTGETRFLDGPSIPDLRSGATSHFQIAQTGTSFDSMDRLLQTSTSTGTILTGEIRSYAGTNPQPTETTQLAATVGQVVWTPQGSIQVPPAPFSFSGKVGKLFDYGSGPDFLLNSETDKLTGRTTAYQYDGLGRVISVTDPDGIITTTDYDAWGRAASTSRLVKGGIGAVTTLHTYDPAGLWSKETLQAEGHSLATTTIYDAWGRVIQAVKPDGSHRESVYDGWGELMSQTPWLKLGQAAFGSTQWSYDGKGRVTKQVDPKGRVVMTAPSDPAWSDAEGGVVTTVLDDRGYPSTGVKDLLGQQRTLLDKNGQRASFTYDPYGHLAQVQFGTQNRRFSYNELGWLMSRTDPEEGTTTYTGFTIAGTPTSTYLYGRNGGGYTYLWTNLDEKGRVSQVQDMLSETILRTFHYDPTHPTWVTGIDDYQPNGGVHEVYGYDALGRMTAKQITDETGQSFMVSRVLDSLGNVKSLTYPSGGSHPAETLLFAYDAFMRPTDATLGMLRGHMDYDRVAGTSVADTLTYGNGAQTVSVTDKNELSRVTHLLGGQAIEDSALTWTAGGLLLGRGNDTFGYDRLGRLLSTTVQGVQGESLTQAFGYDMYGNRTQSSVSLAGGGVSPEALSWTAAYDGTNSLPSKVVAPSGASLQTGAQYDAFGRLSQVWAVPGQSGTMASWVYDSQGRVVQENGTRFLLDASGLRFRRVHPDGRFEYVVYGFDRDPLSTFGSVAPPAQPAVAHAPTRTAPSRRSPQHAR